MPTAAILHPNGVLDGERGSCLRQEAVAVIEAGARSLTIDMEGVTFMDSSGFGALVMVLKRAKQAECRLALSGINSQVRLVLELTGTDRVFEVIADPTPVS